MKNNIAQTQNNAAGFGLLGPLLFIILVGLIVAAVMKLLAIWAAVGLFVLAVVLVVLLSSLSDIRRYMRISSM
ncbi:MAG: hypothetical protein ABIO36_04510 [Pyrinomonadaceae bacterium]